MEIPKVIRYLGIITFGYILLLSLSYSPSDYQPLFTLLVFILVIWVGTRLSRVRNKNSIKVFLGLLLIGGAIRFFWAIFVPTLPISDFEYYRRNAVELSQGIPALTRNMGYTFLLSIGFRISPGVQTGKIINAFASTLSLLLLYVIGLILGKPKMGLVAVFLFAILPSEVNMVSVLGTEVVASTIVLSVAFFLLYGLSSNIDFKHLVAIFCAGLFSGWGLIIRSSLIIYFPVILIGILFARSLFKFGQKIKVFGIFLFGIAMGLFVIVIGYSLMVKKLTFAPLGGQDNLAFLTGTNVKNLGQWNRDDATLFASWPIGQRNELAIQEALRRITSDPINFVKLIPRKYAILFGANDYGNAWSLYAIDWGTGNLWGLHAPAGENWGALGNLKNTILNINGMLSQAVYCIIWFFAFYTFSRKNIPPVFIIILAALIFTLLFHVVLEVQGRYHHYIMPLITLQAAYGLSKLGDVDRLHTLPGSFFNARRRK